MKNANEFLVHTFFCMLSFATINWNNQLQYCKWTSRHWHLFHQRNIFSLVKNLFFRVWISNFKGKYLFLQLTYLTIQDYISLKKQMFLTNEKMIFLNNKIHIHGFLNVFNLQCWYRSFLVHPYTIIPNHIGRFLCLAYIPSFYGLFLFHHVNAYVTIQIYVEYKRSEMHCWFT